MGLEFGTTMKVFVQVYLTFERGRVLKSHTWPHIYSAGACPQMIEPNPYTSVICPQLGITNKFNITLILPLNWFIIKSAPNETVIWVAMPTWFNLEKLWLQGVDPSIEISTVWNKLPPGPRYMGYPLILFQLEFVPLLGSPFHENSDNVCIRLC